jgi:hypothetical protein
MRNASPPGAKFVLCVSRRRGPESDMPDDTDTDSEAAPPDRGSPFPGCFILIAILTVFGGLVVLYTVVGVYQHRAIGTFTQETAASLGLPAPSPEAAASAMGKLKSVGGAVAAGRSERVLFSAEDLNVLIASLDEAKDFRGNARLERIEPGGLVVAMAQPVRKGLFQKGFRYLNGTFVLEPQLRARTIAFKVVAIRPAVGEVPKPFVDSYAAIDLFKLDPELPAIKKHIPSLASVYPEDGKLVVETKTGGGN